MGFIEIQKYIINNKEKLMYLGIGLCIIWGLSIFFALITPPKYLASVKFQLILTEQNTDPFAKNVEFESLIELLKTDHMFEKFIRIIDLYDKNQDMEKIELVTDRGFAQLRNGLDSRAYQHYLKKTEIEKIKYLRKNLTIKSLSNSNIMIVTYQSNSPQKTVELLTQFSDIFIDEYYIRETQEAKDKVSYLKSEIDSLEKQYLVIDRDSTLFDDNKKLKKEYLSQRLDILYKSYIEADLMQKQPKSSATNLRMLDYPIYNPKPIYSSFMIFMAYITIGCLSLGIIIFLLILLENKRLN